MNAARQAFSDPRDAALAQAAADGSAARVKALVAEGANVAAQGDRGTTPLQFALLAASLPGMQALLDAGADAAQPGLDGDTVLHLAALADDPRYLELLLRHGANPSARNARTGAPVLFAALRGRRDAPLRALLAAGADLSATDAAGNTALHQAAKYNLAGPVLTLLEAGAPAAARNSQGASFQTYLFKPSEQVLSAQARRDRERIRDWLVAHGQSVESF